MRLRSLLWGYLVLLPVLPLACGDDSKQSSPGGAGEAGETGDAGAAAGARAGAEGMGGSSSSEAGAGGLEGGSAGALGAGGKPVVGSQCTPRDELPEPLVTTLQTQPVCAAPTGCGGELADTEWAYSQVCLEQRQIFEPIYDECPGAQLNGPADISVVGTLRILGNAATHTAAISGTGVFQIPNQCHSCGCQEYDDVLKQNGAGPNTYCYPDCYPDLSCRCLVDFEVAINQEGRYSTAEQTLTIGGVAYDYCVTDQALTLNETASLRSLPGTATLIPAAATSTPEICDGLDNDKNGDVDDAPLDCPPAPCNDQGVCAEAQPVCVGAWSCDYAAVEHYEATSETTCDGLDNDCDGEVDEELTGCVEICDGLDNDNDGTIDDDPVGSPCLAKLGVCASGTTSTCLGEAGWRCDFDDTDYEADESTCGDAKDNDCDGQIDEGCGCPLGKSQLFVVQWGDNPELIRADLDGGNVQSIMALSDFVLTNIAVDSKNDQLYFGDGDDKLWRSNLDGSGMTQLWTGSSQTWAVNPSTGLLIGECNTSNICRLNAPNTATTLVQPASATWVNIDPVNQKVWWADHSAGYEWNFIHANFDGSSVGGIGEAQLSAPLNFELDPAGQKIYWQNGQAIFQVGMDGSNEQELVPLTASYVYDMAVDHNGGMLYYTEVNGSQVRRVGLDGLSDVQIIPNVSYGIAIDLYICP
jgi:hypothetical protein